MTTTQFTGHFSMNAPPESQSATEQATSAATQLRDRLLGASSDIELPRLSPGLRFSLEVCVGKEIIHLPFTDGSISETANDAPRISISAAPEAWDKVLRTPAVATYHSFTALQIANPEFEVTGDPQVIAQARPLLERLFEVVTACAPTVAVQAQRSLSQISGHYASVSSGHQVYEMYYETAGEGIPLLFLHTAGADGRQYLDQMADVVLGKRYKMYALDLPFHGKSMPPRGWDGAPYKLTAAQYRDWVSAFIDQVIGDSAIIVGGSMGAAMALVLAAECAHQLRGVVALEPPFRSHGRLNPFQNHIQVHGGLHNSAYVRGIMSPTSPIDDRRRASWIYSQGGPGVYPGDLAFYSTEFDGGITAPLIDAAKVPVALLSGNYDYSATPADGAKLAGLIPGARHTIMEGLGHFPMVEHPDAFRPFLIDALSFVTQGI